MNMIDFIYAGKKLSDLGYVVCNFSSQNDTVGMGSNVKFETIKNRTNFNSTVVGYDYEEVISATFSICKNPCLSDTNITESEISYIMGWLNRTTHEKLQPIYDDSSFNDVIYKGSFDISAVMCGGKVCGFDLVFTSNSPFGHKEETLIGFKISSNNGTFTYTNTSDNIGVDYPKIIEIKCKANGNLTISNNLENRVTVINNCKTDEIITIDPINKIISSSLTTHNKLYNDFNYKYPRFLRTDVTNKNILTFSIPCEVKMTVNPIRKVGILV